MAISTVGAVAAVIASVVEQTHVGNCDVNCSMDREMCGQLLDTPGL